MGFFSLVESGLQQVDGLLSQSLRQENALVAEVAEYLLRAGGKRLRPALVLLAGQFGTPGEAQETALITVATAVEMIHMATLVHDDIIDEAVVRRGLAAVRRQYSNPVAVLAGDFLFANAFILLARSANVHIVDLAAKVVNVMCVGEIAQHRAQGQFSTEADYWRRIEAKTGYFLEASCRLGALASDTSVPNRDALSQYGHHIGLAYQVADDLLDWLADPEKLGKAVGGDLAVGIYTLPVLYARSQESYRKELDHYLLAEDVLDHMGTIKEILTVSGALAYSRERALQCVEKAQYYLGLLPERPAKRALQELAEFIVARDY